MSVIGNHGLTAKTTGPALLALLLGLSGCTPSPPQPGPGNGNGNGYGHRIGLGDGDIDGVPVTHRLGHAVGHPDAAPGRRRDRRPQERRPRNLLDHHP